MKILPNDDKVIQCSILFDNVRSQRNHYCRKVVLNQWHIKIQELCQDSRATRIVTQTKQSTLKVELLRAAGTKFYSKLKFQHCSRTVFCWTGWFARLAKINRILMPALFQESYPAYLHHVLCRLYNFTYWLNFREENSLNNLRSQC